MSNDPNMGEFIEDTYNDSEKKATAEAKDFADGMLPEKTDAELLASWAEWAKNKGNAKVYIPLRTMNLLHMSEHAMRVIVGPVSSGKSYGCHYDVPLRCAKQSVCKDGNIHNRALFSRGTYQQLKQTTFGMWMRMFPTTEIALSSPIMGKLTLKLGNRLSIMEILGIPMDMTGAEATLRSNAFSIARVEELQYIPYSAVTVIRERLGRYPDVDMAPFGFQKSGYFKNLGLTADTNCPVEGSWIHKRATKIKPDDEFYLFQPPAMFRNWNGETKEWDYVENRGQRFATHGIHAAENIEHINEGWDYYWNMVSFKEEDDIRRNVLNEYGHVLSGTPVFPEFRIDRHVCSRGIPMPPRGTYLFCGMDLGRTPRAVFGYYGKNGGLVCPMVLAKDCGIQMFAETIMRPALAARGISPSQVTIFPDPAGDNQGGQVEATDVEILRACGFNVALPVLKNNDPLTRVETVKQALTRMTSDGDPYVQLDPSCEELIQALAGGYTYAITRGANGQVRTGDKPDKKSPYSHIADAFQYLLVGLKYGAKEERAFGGMRAGGFAERFAQASDGRDRGLFC